MTSIRNRGLAPNQNKERELAILRAENERLRQENDRAFAYVRSKVDALLSVIGTKSLLPEELDNHSLVEFDPIGIVTQSFQHVLDNVHKTNHRLRFAHDEIQTIFDTVGVSILVLDTKGRVMAYNQKTRDMMLDTEADISGQYCRDHICRDRTSEDRCVFREVSKTEREHQFNDWSLNGHSFDVVGRPMFNDSGQLSHVVISYKDVTARRDAESALIKALTETQQANAKLHGILRSAADGILVTDADERIVLMNSRAEELFGLCLADRRIASNLEILQHQALVSFLKEVSESPEGFVAKDFVFSDPGGREHIHQARVSVIDTPKTGFSGCITILHDVTEERQVERMKSEFVSTAAHELRTPLATIIGYADLLLMKEDWSKKEQRDYLGLIQEKAERLGDIVSDLLDISRIESGEGVLLDPKPCSLELLCKEVVRSFRHQSEKHTFEVESSGSASICADRYAVLQILENLISNALKYSPQGGLIKISVSRHGCYCRCSVTDQGMGMTSVQVEKVYDKFYRVDATNTAVSGTGLGMTIVKHLVDAHGGKIDISSTPDQGTTVTVAFPCTENES